MNWKKISLIQMLVLIFLIIYPVVRGATSFKSVKLHNSELGINLEIEDSVGYTRVVTSFNGKPIFFATSFALSFSENRYLHIFNHGYSVTKDNIITNEIKYDSKWEMGVKHVFFLVIYSNEHAVVHINNKIFLFYYDNIENI